MEERGSVFSSLWDVHRNFKGVISVQSELHGRFWRSNQRQLAGAWWTASASLVLRSWPAWALCLGADWSALCSRPGARLAFAALHWCPCIPALPGAPACWLPQPPLAKGLIGGTH